MYALALLIEGAMFASLVILVLVYKHLVPLETMIAKKKEKEDILKKGSA